MKTQGRISKLRILKTVRNERGSLAMDFVFARVLVGGFTAILGGFALTLSAVEGVQYLAFASSRVYFAAHQDKTQQEQLAQNKFDQLRKTPGFARFLNPNWFDLSMVVGDFSDNYSKEYSRDVFEGVSVNFTAKLLAFRIPFFGSTTNDEDGFSTKVTSFIGREPTANECMDFVRQRWDAIKQSVPGANMVPTEEYLPLADNGC